MTRSDDKVVKAGKSIVTLNEEFDEVLSAKEGQDVERMESGVRSVNASGRRQHREDCDEFLDQ